MSDTLRTLRREYDRLAALVPKLEGEEYAKAKEEKRAAFQRWWDADQAAKNAPPVRNETVTERPKPVAPVAPPVTPPARTPQSRPSPRATTTPTGGSLVISTPPSDPPKAA
jgi:hypothetical protein